MAERPKTTKLEIHTTPEGAARLRALFASGKLKELAGIPVIAVEQAGPDDVNIQTTGIPAGGGGSGRST